MGRSYRPSNKVCPTCGSPLMKIDHHGEVLIGCVHCNYWGRPGDKWPIHGNAGGRS
jgi:hypothetical protein